MGLAKQLKTKNKAVIWLILAISLILAPLLYAAVFVFPLLSSMLQLIVVLMHASMAGAFLLLFKKWNKVKSDMIFTLMFIALLLLPVGFFYFMVMPLMASTLVGLIYVLMHFVFAGGVILAVAFKSSISKLF